MDSQAISFVRDPVIRVGMLGVVFIVALGFERVRPLRTPTQPKMRRVIRNVSIAAIGAVVFRVLVAGIVIPVSAWSARHTCGAIPWLIHVRWLQIVLGIVALDYLEYWWHWINHRIPFFWRFHRAHHVDLDLDVSTATRFHFGELFFAGFVQTVKVFILGVDPATFLLFQSCLVIAALFQHSNVRLPLALERFLVMGVVTPRMHGIHHSIVWEETNSNFSVIFSWWDRLHGSVMLNVPQAEIIIGVPSYRDPTELTFGKVLFSPLRWPRDWIQVDSHVSARAPRLTPRTVLSA